MPAVPYDRERHWRPLADAYCHGAGVTRADLRRLLSTDARAVVYEGHEPVMLHGVPRALVLGFVVVGLRPQTVHWAYVRPSNRGQGLLGRMLAAAKVDRTRQIDMLTRTPAAEQVVRKLTRRGWRVRFPPAAEPQSRSAEHEQGNEA